MYMNTSFLSPAMAYSDPRMPHRAIKKVPLADQGRGPRMHPLNSKFQSRVLLSTGARARASLVKQNFNSKFMDHTLGEIARDIWAALGPGYSESVYHCAFEVALRNRLINYETERIIPVFYDGQNVGNVRADLIIDRKVVVELKSVSKLNEQYRIQTRNYLKLLGLEMGYLINFPDKNGPIEFETIIQDRPVQPTLDHIDC